ncbi:hypothetical protein L873DRAFT_1848187 [Choiromyces venosus 120613-1]|uniref:Suppressor of forked domain-containing protein n=1 Tax=Choiromyces venosus 120613-1 TaxID=1336337 RepID=A0A3N4J571_9PEZI|nr:hypothetical protein L873DRAFT_1848187 [Choiromyces venosus 120613-1]
MSDVIQKAAELDRIHTVCEECTWKCRWQWLARSAEGGLLAKGISESCRYACSRRRAVMEGVDQFEQGLNKLMVFTSSSAGGGLIPSALIWGMVGENISSRTLSNVYDCRGCLIKLCNITKGLGRDTLRRLPPASGYEGYEDYMRHVELWKGWIQWERGDPLVRNNT